MQEKSKEEILSPRLYTIHSQKGGVGKTSIALAIAGFGAIYHNVKSLIIDADLTGTSLVDLPGWSNNKKPQYFNELILANPSKFQDYTPLISHGVKKEGPDLNSKSIDQFYAKVPLPNVDKMYYIPGSPLFKDIQQIIPLISQEDRLCFFKHRLEDIIVTAIGGGFKVIVIDNPPGLFGISTSSLRIVLDRTRLDKIHRIVGDDPNGIDAHSFLVTTPDPVDYRALFPSFSSIIEKNMELLKNERFDVILNKTNEIDPSSEDRFDAVKAYKKILDDIEKERPDGRKIDKDLIELFRRRVKKVGASACGYFPNFYMDRILSTIESITNKKDEGYTGMEEWCKQVGKITRLYQK